MRCPSCGEDDDRVVDSRPASEGEAIRRRRECGVCGLRYTTFERVELPELVVLKSSGTTEAFDRAKVREGIARAAKGRIEPEAVERAAAAVETALRANGARQATSEQVGLHVLGQLRDLDEVAYVRFASVYKDFQGPEDFEKELKSLRKAFPARRR
ncbi:MAG: transcriptional regulator NrdR [Nitriliruptorales bacterium]